MIAYAESHDQARCDPAAWKGRHESKGLRDVDDHETNVQKTTFFGGGIESFVTEKTTFFLGVIRNTERVASHHKAPILALSSFLHAMDLVL